MFDVGANIGMSGQYFRNLGFKGKIVSFEPVSDLFRQLSQTASKDPLWLCENVALGELEGTETINISGGGGGASSLLMTDGKIQEKDPELGVVGQETVRVSTLASAMRKYYPDGDRLFLKLDAQGYEKKILNGGLMELHRVVGMRIEMSIVRIYQEEPLIYEMLPCLYDLGFRLCAIEEAWSNRETQEVYQIDATLFRPDKCGLAH